MNSAVRIILGYQINASVPSHAPKDPVGYRYVRIDYQYTGKKVFDQRFRTSLLLFSR